jgi:hypothetical protein
MPMIDAYATTGTFADPQQLAQAATGDPTIADRTWVLLTEAPEGGWGLWGHAHTNAELIGAARAQIAELAGNPAQG